MRLKRKSLLRLAVHIERGTGELDHFDTAAMRDSTLRGVMLGHAHEGRARRDGTTGAARVTSYGTRDAAVSLQAGCQPVAEGGQHVGGNRLRGERGVFGDPGGARGVVEEEVIQLREDVDRHVAVAA